MVLVKPDRARCAAVRCRRFLWVEIVEQINGAQPSELHCGGVLSGTQRKESNGDRRAQESTKEH